MVLVSALVLAENLLLRFRAYLNAVPSVEVGVTEAATLPFITSSVSLTSEREGDGRTNSATRP
ncbi:hypothetical protein Tco_0081331, partial [Tanacetum coccineum]